MKEILLGFEIGTGRKIFVKPSHLVVTGITQLSGKTTTLLAIIKRGQFKAIVFKTKIGEKGITEGTIIPPYYKDEFDWEYASDLLEASRKEKLKFERAWIIKYSKTATNLLEFKKNIDDAIPVVKRDLEKNVLITLQAYLDKILPELQYAPLSNTLDLREGINIMDLERFREETQSLIIRSVLREVLKKEKNTVIVIPECLDGDTLVSLKDGRVKKIKDIKNKDEVVGGKVSNRFTKQFSKILKFSGSFELKTSLTHPCFLIRKERLRKGKHDYRKIGSVIPEVEIEMVLAKDVNIGDYFLIPEKLPHKTVYHWTSDQLGFISLILTDGNVRIGKNYGLIRVNVTKDKDWFRNEFKKGLKSFGYEDTFKETIDKRGNILLWSNSRELTDILWSFGCRGGKKAPSIDIVNQIFLSPLKSIARFINIAICCDGNVHKGGYIRFGSTSEIFVKKLQLLLLKFGIYSNIREQNKKNPNHNNFWELVIFRDSIKKFVDKIDIDLPRKKIIVKEQERKERYAIFRGKKYILHSVHKIEKLDTSNNFYDFTTEKEYFIANGILTHNCWKYVPEGIGSPVKRDAEAFIRQGATNGNYLFLDSQDITAGVDKKILKQVSTWIMGYQREINEIKRTLDQLPIPQKDKPKTDDIATLKLGQFYVATSDFTKKVYIQPIWLDTKTAKKIALGKINVNTIKQPETLTPFSIVQPELKVETITDLQPMRREINELRNDFFNKIQQQQEAISKVYSDLFTLKSSQPIIDEDTIVAKVLQKVKIPQSGTGIIDVEPIVQQVLQRMPKQVGTQIYEVAPLEKIKKDFLEETKNNILSIISSLDDKQKKMLKWIEQNAKNTKKNEIFLNCFGKSATGGQTYMELGKKILEMKNFEIIRVDTQQRIFPNLKGRINNLIAQYGATEQEIQQVYDHILNEMI